jgi:hypothetical protein
MNGIAKSEVTRKLKAPVFPKFDKRLLGSWKSDRARTFEEWSWTKRLSPRRKKGLQSLFGKLKITYTRTKVISTLHYRQWEQSSRYKVVATDEASVAIVKYGKLHIKNRQRYDPENLKFADALFPSKPTILHIHFTGKYYWISLGTGRNREFFRKIREGK